MSETRWWWIRHAPVRANNGRLYGSDDLPCDVSDRETFAKLAKLLPPSAIWVTSHLQRTHQTADAVLLERPELAPLDRMAEENLGEQSFGDWQGLHFEELEEARDGAWHRFWLAPAHERPPGGESFEDLSLRVAERVAALTEQHKGHDLIAVTHGGTIRAALTQALGIAPERALSFSIDNCSLTRIDHIVGAEGSHAPHTRESWRVGLVNHRP